MTKEKKLRLGSFLSISRGLPRAATGEIGEYLPVFTGTPGRCCQAIPEREIKNGWPCGRNWTSSPLWPPALHSKYGCPREETREFAAGSWPKTWSG